MNLAIIHNLPPGGQKRALYEQVKRLSKRHTIDLFTLSSTNETFLPLKPFVRHHFAAPYSYPPHFPRSLLSIYFDLPKAYKKLAEKINSGHYDLAYVNTCYLTQTPYILRYLRIPSLYFCPEPKREFYENFPRVSNRLTYAVTYPFRLAIKDIDQTNIRYASLILTNSKYSKAKILETYGVKSSVNYLGVDTKIFRPLQVPTPSGESLRNTPEVSLSPIVLTVGEFSLHKGHDFIIRSLSQIPENIRPKLVIAGHGGIERGYLKQLAGGLRVELEIIDNPSDKELVRWYNRASLFVYAASNEPFGLAVLEALSCGAYVLAVNEGGIPEIVTEPFLGQLVSRNEKLFAKKIETVIAKKDLHTNREKRHRWVKEHWNWEKSVGELENYLEGVPACRQAGIPATFQVS